MAKKPKITEKLTLTPEETAQLEPHAKKWRDIALRTTPQTDAERAECSTALARYYELQGLKPLDPEWIIYARSPIEARIISGLLAGGWHLHLDADPKNWTKERLVELREYCKNLPRAKKLNLTEWFTHPYSIKQIEKDSGLGKWGLDCIQVAYKMWHGGNLSVSSEAFVSFFKDVVKIDDRYDIDMNAWSPWETATKLGGPRFLHKDFAVISDFPEIMTYDERQRPHGENGKPHAQWSDGSALFYHHGVRVPAWVYLTPEQLTGERVLKEQNAEVRRVMIEMMTPAKFIQSAKAKIVHEDLDQLGKPRRLLRVEMNDDEPLVMVEVTNSTAEPDGTFRLYHLRVDPNAYGGRAGKECLAAIASTWREKKVGTPLMFKTPEEYRLAVET